MPTQTMAATSRLRHSGAVWLGGLAMGAAAVRRAPLLGAKRLLLPTSYWRTAEFAYVYGQLGALPAGARVLDVGSPKDLASILARRRGFHVTATDILPRAVNLCARYVAAQGITGDGPGQVTTAIQDGRRLDYPDASFDAAFAVSVIEHIPDAGDTAAVGELLRVVKPGGPVVLTVPYALEYRDTFVDRPVYERCQTAGERVFWERHYDDAALSARLLDPTGARCRDRQVWGENRVRGERLLHRAGRLRAALSPVEPLLATLALHPSPRHPMAAFLVLVRP